MTAFRAKSARGPPAHVARSEAEGNARPHRDRAAPPSTTRRTPSRASSSPASASRGSLDAGSFVEDAALANNLDPELPADGVITGTGADRRAHRRHHGQRLDGEGRLVGPAHGREDPPHPGDGAAPARARCSTWSTARARASPTRSRCSPGGAAPGRIFYNQVQMSGAGAAGLPALRPERGGRRVHPGVLRRRRDGRRQRQHVPRQPAHGRDGHRREGDARGDGRRPDALHASAAAATSSARPRTRPSPSASATSPSCRGSFEGRPAARGRARPEDERQAHRGHHPRRREQALRHDGASSARSSTRARGSRSRRSSRARSSPASRASTGGRWASSPTSPSGWAASSSSTAPTRPRASSGCATPSTSRSLYLADVPGFMIGTKVERQGIIRAGAKMIAAVSEATVPEAQRHRAQGLRRGPLRHVRARLRARRVHRAAHRLDRRDGPAGGGQRRLLQQDPGDPRGPRARRLRRQAARRVPRRHRPA